MKKFQLCYSKCFELALKSASQVRIDSSKLLEKKSMFCFSRPLEVVSETERIVKRDG